MTDADGKVFAFWQPSTQTASGTSIFSTGETWFALNRLERLFPDAEWREPAERVGRYVMQHRDDAEDVFPPTSDHWGAYAVDEMQQWTTPPSAELTKMTDAYAERLAGHLRRAGAVRVATHRLGRERAAPRPPGAAVRAGHPRRRSRRTRPLRRARGRPEDAAAITEPDGVCSRRCSSTAKSPRTTCSADGAWFHSDVTQMDDQQHPLSTLVAYG